MRTVHVIMTRWYVGGKRQYVKHGSLTGQGIDGVTLTDDITDAFEFTKRSAAEVCAFLVNGELVQTESVKYS